MHAHTFAQGISLLSAKQPIFHFSLSYETKHFCLQLSGLSLATKDMQMPFPPALGKWGVRVERRTIHLEF